MARREYLSFDERTRFDTPPILTPQVRPIFLDLPTWALNYLEQTLTPTNQVGFILQLGYFRIVGRFFVADRFRPDDLNWIASQLHIEPRSIQLLDYASKQTGYRHHPRTKKPITSSGPINVLITSMW